MVEIKDLEERHKALKEQMSKIRKMGADVTIPMLLLHKVPTKLKLAAIDNNAKEINTVIQLLTTAQQELQEAKQKQETASHSTKVEQLCMAVKNAVSYGHKDEALESYKLLRAEYDQLSEKEKPLYTKQCIELYQGLTKEVNNGTVQQEAGGGVRSEERTTTSS